MTQLANLLEIHAEALVRRWIEEVRAELAPKGKSEPELRDHIPDFLRELMAALRRGKAPAKSLVAAEHGRQRYRIGFDVDALVREYGLLRGSLLDLIEQTGCPMTLPELRVLTDFFATAIAEAVREHGQQQKHEEFTLAQAHVQALRESEERYRTVFEFIDDGFCLVQVLFDAGGRPVDYRFLETNAAFEAQSGLQGVSGRTALELVPDLDAFWFQLYGKVALTGETARVENHVPAMGRWFEVYASRVGRPELRQVALVFKDITERRTLLAREQAARAEAEAERQKLLSLFVQAPVAIAIQEGPQHAFAFANPAFRALAGGRDVVGKPFAEALPELRGQGFDAVLDRVVATGEPFVGNEVPARMARTGRGTSDEAFYTFVYSPKRDARGQVDGVLQCAYEVTEQVVARRQAEELAEKLRESEERLRRVMEASDTATWELDPVTQAFKSDARQSALLGVPADAPLTFPVLMKAIHPDDRERTERAVGAALRKENGGRYYIELRTTDEGGAPVRWLEGRGQAFFGADGQAVRLTGTTVDITRRKEGEAERERLLGEVEAARVRLAALFENAPLLICTLRGPDHVFELVNTAYQRLIGMGRALVGLPVREALPEIVEQGFIEMLDGVYRTGKPLIARAVPIRLDRQGSGVLEEFFFHQTYQPRRDPQGQVVGIDAFGFDVTEQVQARQRAEALSERLRESEEHLRRVVEASGTGTWEMDTATETLVADARFREIFGLSADEPFPLSKGLSIIHPEDSPRVAKAITEALAGRNGGRYHEEYRIAGAPEGRPRWVEARGQAQLGAEGKPVRLLGTGVEITARKEAEAAREELLASLIHQSVFGVTLLRGARLVFERANAAYRQLVGNREVEGKCLLEALPELEGQGFETVLRGVQRTGNPFIGREVHVRMDRRGQGVVEDVYFNAVYQPVRIPGGACPDVLIIVHDVTETVRARMETARLLALEKERSEFEQQLIGIVSHDLRNPLNAILLSTTALARREELDERTTKAVLRMQSSADRAVRMVKDLLDFTQARLGTGIPVHPRPLDLHAFTRLVVEEVHASCPERTIGVEAEGDGKGAWDADRIAQLVTNLVSNAVRYSPEGTGVSVRTRGKADGVELEVHNEGVPIPPEALGRLFEPMQRLSSKTDTSGRSVGLGLYIVRHIVVGHGGTIEVKSTAEEGTTFTVKLPRRPPRPNQTT